MTWLCCYVQRVDYVAIYRGVIMLIYTWDLLCRNIQENDYVAIYNGLIKPLSVNYIGMHMI